MNNLLRQREGQADLLSLFGEIGFEIRAEAVRDALAASTSKELLISLNSQGGNVFEGQAIYSLLTAHKKAGHTVTVRIEGIAASMGSIIAMVGDRIEMPANAFLMLHNPVGVWAGDSEELADYAALMLKVEDTLAAIYSKRSGQSIDAVKALMKAETWLTATEAKEAGFCDEVIDAVAIAAVGDLSRFGKAPAALSKTFPDPQAAKIANLEAFHRGTMAALQDLGIKQADPATIGQAIIARVDAQTTAKINATFKNLGIEVNDGQDLQAVVAVSIEKRASAKACEILAKQGADTPLPMNPNHFTKATGLSGYERAVAANRKP